MSVFNVVSNIVANINNNQNNNNNNNNNLQINKISTQNTQVDIKCLFQKLVICVESLCTFE